MATTILVNTEKCVSIIHNKTISYEFELALPIQSIVKTSTNTLYGVSSKQTLLKYDVSSDNVMSSAPIHHIMFGISRIYFVNVGFQRTSLFYLTNQNQVFVSTINVMEKIGEPKYTVSFKNTVVHMMNSDSIWYVCIHRDGKSYIQMYDMNFSKEIQKPILICDRHINKIIMIGCVFCYSTNNKLYTFDILNSSMKCLKTFDYVITDVTCNDVKLFIVLNQQTICHGSIDDALSVPEHTELDFEFITQSFDSKIVEIYSVTDDIHWGSSSINSSYVNCISHSLLQPIIQTRQLRIVESDIELQTSTEYPISDSIAIDIYQKMNITMMHAYAKRFRQSHNTFFDVDPMLSLKANKGAMWHLLDLENTNRFEQVLSTGISYLLYVHPNTGWIHAVPDHSEFIKVLKTTNNNPLFISQVCFEGERHSECYHEHIQQITVSL